MNLNWSDILNNLLASIILAPFGVLAGFLGAWIIKAVSSRVSSGKKSMRWLSWLFFNAVLVCAVFLSPSKADDAQVTRKALTASPFAISANVIIAKKSKSDSRGDLKTEEFAQGITQIIDYTRVVWGRMAGLEKENEELLWQIGKLNKKRSALSESQNPLLSLFGDSPKVKEIDDEVARYYQQVDKNLDEMRILKKDPAAYYRSRKK
jgi:hypothetical protein